MGLVEEVAHYVSIKGVVLCAIGLYILYSIAIRVDKTVRLNRLGARAKSYPTYLPYGLDMIRKTVTNTLNHKNLEMWREIFEKCGGWTGEARIAGLRIVFTADPENIKAILATQFGDYGKGKPFHEEWKPFLGDSIFATDGDKWHTSRQLIRPQFVKERVSDLHTFEEHLDTFFKCMYNGGALDGRGQKVNMGPNGINGKVFDISDIFFRYTLDVATDFLLGHDVQSMSTIRQEFADAFNDVQHIQNVMTRAGPLRWIVPKFAYYRNLKIIDEFINPFIERTLRLSPAELSSKTKTDEGYTFLHELASFTRDRKILRDQLIAVLLAGRDTTAATLSWTIYELGRHPEVVAKLRAEIMETVGDERTPTYADLKGMKYLQNVMNETLRLYPVVPFNVRMALKDCTLPRGGGPDGTQPLAVLKDTPIGYSTLVMQRRKDLYPPVSEKFPDSDVFCPDRWFNWQPQPWKYIPFNGGPRICIGQQFALTEMGYVLVRMFQKFDRVVSYMDQIDGGHPTLKAEIVLQPGDGVNVAFWEAKKSQSEATA